MDLLAIQAALTDADFDGWLLCDFHNRDPIAYRILNLDSTALTKRAWFYYVPSKGEPTRISHRVEPTRLVELPGSQELYLTPDELHAALTSTLGTGKKIAMQYSPMNQIPQVSLVDAGTVELVRSLGNEIVSSADLVQAFEAVLDEEGLRSHEQASEIVHTVKDAAFSLMDEALRRSETLTEFDVAQFILRQFEQAGVTAEGDTPIVGFNDHPANPHFEPTAKNAHTLKYGDSILVDLWARSPKPTGVYADITWCGFAGPTPPPLLQEIFCLVCEARDAALEFVRSRFEAGLRCQGFEVDQVARRVIADGGYGEQFIHRTGHNISGQLHGAGANLDDLETHDYRTLLPGTCFSIEPGIYLEGRMAVRCEIDVFITLDGKARVSGPIQRELVAVG